MASHVRCRDTDTHTNTNSEIFGKCLALDNAIQCTDMDEFSYQEMIAFLPLQAHSKPARVLVSLIGTDQVEMAT